MSHERLFEQMTDAVIAGLPDKARELAQESLQAGVDPLEAIDRGFKPGMDVVGDGLVFARMKPNRSAYCAGVPK